MICLLRIVLFVLMAAVPAFAQRSYYRDSPRTMVDLWDTMPDRRSCVEQLLARRNPPMTVEDLKRQGIPPTDPSVMAMMQQCRGGSPLQADRASDVVRGQGWSETSPERQLAFMTFQAGLIVQQEKVFSCVQSAQAQISLQARKKCLSERGYEYTSVDDGECRLKIIEQVPLQTNVPRTWDGKPLRPQVVARELDIPLALLKPDNIERVAGSFTLPFENRSGTFVVQKIRLAESSDKWVELEQPPAPSSNLQQYGSQFAKWFQDRKQLGELATAEIASAIPVVSSGLPVSYGFTPGIQLVVSSKGSGLIVHYNFGGPQESDLADPFVATVKAVIAKCVH